MEVYFVLAATRKMRRVLSCTFSYFRVRSVLWYFWVLVQLLYINLDITAYIRLHAHPAQGRYTIQFLQNFHGDHLRYALLRLLR